MKALAVRFFDTANRKIHFGRSFLKDIVKQLQD